MAQDGQVSNTSHIFNKMLQHTIQMEIALTAEVEPVYPIDSARDSASDIFDKVPDDSSVYEQRLFADWGSLHSSYFCDLVIIGAHREHFSKLWSVHFHDSQVSDQLAQHEYKATDGILSSVHPRFQTMIKIMSSTTYNNAVALSGNSRRQCPTAKKKVVVRRNLSMTARGSFKWASSNSSLSLTPNFILPVERRPNIDEVSKTGIPLIDMESASVIEEIARASEEYGFFLITNHGIPQELCDAMLSALIDLFHLPPSTKSLLVSDDPTRDVRISNHYRKDDKKGKMFSMWSEVFKHPWHPTDDTFTLLLPSDAPDYRSLVSQYAKKMGVLMNRLLSLMSRGLELESDHFVKVLGENPLYRTQGNYYPTCSNPDLTLGLGAHTDRDALTVVLPSPNVGGLQIMKDGKWIAVDPMPNALVVNLGDQLQVLSNGKYKSVVHRVVTNEYKSRASLAMFYGPDKNALIGPIENLIDQQRPPLYRHYYFTEFLEEFRKQEGKNRKVKEVFEI